MKIRQARHRRALATIITSAIMMSAVTMTGSAGVVWSQSSLTEKQADMTDTAVNYMNKLNESLIFENVYCTSDPCEQINVILTNVGHVGLEVSKVTISTSGFSKIHPVLNGQIMPDHSIAIQSAWQKLMIRHLQLPSLKIPIMPKVKKLQRESRSQLKKHLRLMVIS